MGRSLHIPFWYDIDRNEFLSSLTRFYLKNFQNRWATQLQYNRNPGSTNVIIWLLKETDFYYNCQNHIKGRPFIRKRGDMYYLTAHSIKHIHVIYLRSKLDGTAFLMLITPETSAKYRQQNNWLPKCNQIKEDKYNRNN